MKSKYPRFKRRAIMGRLEGDLGEIISFVEVPYDYYCLCVSSTQRALHRGKVRFYSSALGQQYLRNYIQEKGRQR